MRDQTVQSFLQRTWELARKQHGVVARRQLLAMQMTPKAIKYALSAGRLHRTEWRGVYAVGRPELSEYGRLMAAVLWAGPGAVLSHESAADLWRIRRNRSRTITLSVPAVRRRVGRRGVTVHRRARLGRREVTRQRGIPVTNPTWTLIDLATTLERRPLEAAVNQADALNLLRVDTLREELDRAKGQPGVRLLREILDRDAFLLTDSELERLFVPIAKRAGLPRPETQVEVNGHRVDFYFRELDLVVECNGLRYHRTPLQQRNDALRHQAHEAAGTRHVPFTYAQIAREPDHVVGTLVRIRRRSARLSAG